jgi:RNA polymerase sigma-70 factor (ECF subfamily)
VARAQRRKITRRREGQSALLDDLPIAATQHGQLEDREALALGQRLLEQLPAPLREVFWLYEVEDMSMSEVASALDCPLQTAYSRLHTARRRILEAVAQADRAVGGHD